MPHRSYSQPHPRERRQRMLDTKPPMLADDEFREIQQVLLNLSSARHLEPMALLLILRA